MDNIKNFEDFLDRMQGLLDSAKKQGHIIVRVEDLENTFPELAESEDEKIRKAIHIYLDWLDGRKDYAPKGKYTIKDMISWLEKQGEPTDINPSEFDLRLNKLLKQFETLPKEELASSLSFYLNVVQNNGTYKHEEKQGEQKSADKVEPKFHEGEWMCENEPNNYARFIQILEIVNVQGKERYRISRDIRNNEDIVEFNFIEKYFHKFDIKDAKDGDVLQLGKVTAIFKEHISNVSCKCHCSVYNGKFEIPSQNDDDICYGCHDATPATKEHRDLLFKKMKEAGYKWDAEIKELKEIEQEPTEWSEEDENNLYLTTKAVEREYSGELFLNPKIVNEQVGIGRKLINWLRSFENRVQPKQEWSEEDENYMKSAIELIMHCIWKSYRGLYKEDVVEWLKSLKYRFTENKEEFKE